MPEKRIVFVPYKLHLRHILFILAKKMPITVMLPPEKTLPSDSKIDGVPITYWQFFFGFLKKIIGSEVRTLKYIKGLSKILNKINIDTLITFEFYHWYTFQCISYKKRHPDIKLFLFSETKLWPKNIFANILKRFLFLYFRLNLKHIDQIFVYTETARNFLKKYIPKTKVILLPTPIDLSLFKPITDKQFCPNGELRLLMNARFSRYKRHDDLFDAVKILIEEGKKLKVTCISRYEKDWEQILNLAIKKGVQNAIEVLDTLPPTEMPNLYYMHDVLVLPSYNEAIGLVVPEAMACGTPTITSDTVGGNVYVKNRETGFIFKTGDIVELANCIRNYFSVDLLKQFSHNAAIHIEKNFTPEITAKIFEEILASTEIDKK